MVGWRVRLKEHRLGAKRRQTNTPSLPHSHPGRMLLHGGVARSIVGAPPRCEAKANQYTEPALFAPGAGAPTGWGDAFSCRSTATVRSEGKPIHRARPLAPGAGAPTGWGGAFDCRSTASVRSEGKPIHRARPVRIRGGCSYRCCAEMKKPPHLSMRGLLIW